MVKVKLKRCPNKSRRNKKTLICDKYPAKKTVKQLKSKSLSKSKTKTKSLPKSKDKSTNALKIVNFMKQTKHQRHSHFLKNICSDSDVCIAFGIESNKIKAFFNNFTNFDYVIPPITSIGVPSGNGFIKEVNYRHRNYLANAILKSSVKPSADNLFYEYTVGLKVNQWTKYFPCFVETYGLYKYKTDDYHKYVKNTKKITNVSKLKDALTLVSTSTTANPVYNYGDICQDSKYYAVLIQHIRNAKTLSQMGDNLKAKNILAILAQVYFPLSQLTNAFVHYDLHSKNVMLYQPAKKKYINFNYYFADGSIVQFNSYYVAKIIDYGRSYIKESPQIYETICKTSKCDTCGEDYGFGWLDPVTSKSDYYISSTNTNPSHDLRLFNIYFPSIVKYDLIAGTKPINYHSYNIIDPLFKIQNVMDASYYLKHFIKSKEESYTNTVEFPKNKKFGELHIYLNMSKPMRFIKT